MAVKKPKVTKPKPKPKIAKLKEKEKDNRQSVAEYPAPQGVDGEELMDAIPSWTQPIGADGDWDKVS
jgi:hypothetical protein